MTDVKNSDLAILRETMKMNEDRVFNDILESLDELENGEKKEDALERRTSNKKKKEKLVSFSSVKSLFTQPAPIAVQNTSSNLCNNHLARLIQPAVNRESIAYSIRLIGEISKTRFKNQSGFTGISIELNKIAEIILSVPKTAFEETVLGRRLRELATQCSVVEEKTAADLWLITADYYEYLLRGHVDAADALDNARRFIVDTRTKVQVLEKSRDLFVKGQRYDQALRVERI